MPYHLNDNIATDKKTLFIHLNLQKNLLVFLYNVVMMFTVEPCSAVGKKIDTQTEVTDKLVKISDKASKQYCIMPKKFADTCLERIKNFEVYEDDIWIVTFPKCGTTWTQEMLWLINNDLNYEEAKSKDLLERFPFLEWGGVIRDIEADYVEMSNNLTRPRLIKSHLPMFLLPNKFWSVKPKIVYVARNPKDVAISFYHHHCHLHGYRGSKETYIESFVNDEVLYQPYNEHVLEFWKIRNEPNILFLFYEEMKKDLDHEVKKVMKFLNKDFSQSQIDELCNHLSFDSMKENKSVNKEDEIRMLKESAGEKYDRNEFSFIRKGQVGSYKVELTAEENQKLDVYSQHPEFKKFGFAYRF